MIGVDGYGGQTLGIGHGYDGLVAAAKAGLGDFAYQWPNPTGHSFSVPEVCPKRCPNLYHNLYRKVAWLKLPQLNTGQQQLWLAALGTLSCPLAFS
jgi:hypothetical protein